ncbi:MAG TPA: hypothetical protein PLP17_07080, partial [Oligoflexia bacterium]|nr:hypothetical protein [Oligoflexia bacterium]
MALATVAAAAGIIWILAHCWLKNTVASAIASSYLILVLTLFGHVHGALYRVVLDRTINPQQVIDDKLFLQAALSVFFILLPFSIWRFTMSSTKRLGTANMALNIASGTLLLFALFGLLQHQKDNTAFEDNIAYLPHDAASTELDDRPDVYYVILDGYARQDVLRDYFDMDNRAFTGFLQRHGFFVAEKSSANYWWTILSLASSLNFSFLETSAQTPINPSAAAQMIQDSRTSRMLRKLGYRYLHISSTWLATAQNSYADQVLGRNDWLNNEY